MVDICRKRLAAKGIGEMRRHLYEIETNDHQEKLLEEVTVNILGGVFVEAVELASIKKFTVCLNKRVR